MIRGILRDARRASGLSQRALAAKLGKSQSHINMIEQGQRRVDALELFALADLVSENPIEVLDSILTKLDELKGSHGL